MKKLSDEAVNRVLKLIADELGIQECLFQNPRVYYNGQEQGAKTGWNELTMSVWVKEADSLPQKTIINNQKGWFMPLITAGCRVVFIMTGGIVGLTATKTGNARLILILFLTSAFSVAVEEATKKLFRLFTTNT